MRRRLTKGQRRSLLVFYGVLPQSCAGPLYNTHLYAFDEGRRMSIRGFVSFSKGPQPTAGGTARVARILKSWGTTADDRIDKMINPPVVVRPKYTEDHLRGSSAGMLTFDQTFIGRDIIRHHVYPRLWVRTIDPNNTSR